MEHSVVEDVRARRDQCLEGLGELGLGRVRERGAKVPKRDRAHLGLGDLGDAVELGAQLRQSRRGCIVEDVAVEFRTACPNVKV